MKYVFLFILINYGLTMIVLYGSILESFRVWWRKKFCNSLLFKLMDCELCVSFHTGWITFILFWFFGNIKLFNNIYVGSFLFGCLSSGTSYILSCLFDDYGLRIEKTVNKDK